MQWPSRRIASRLPVSRECIAIRASRRLRSVDVIHVLSDLFILRGVSGQVRSDNGPEFIAKAVREFDRGGRCQDRLHHGGQPMREYCVSFNSKPRVEPLNARIFSTLEKARAVIEGWRRHTIRASAPAPEAMLSGFATRPSFAGHAGRSATTNHELTSLPDHSMGATAI
jgi:putative transposase